MKVMEISEFCGQNKKLWLFTFFTNNYETLAICVDPNVDENHGFSISRHDLCLSILSCLSCPCESQTFFTTFQADESEIPREISEILRRGRHESLFKWNGISSPSLWCGINWGIYTYFVAKSCFCLITKRTGIISFHFSVGLSRSIIAVWGGVLVYGALGILIGWSFVC